MRCLSFNSNLKLILVRFLLDFCLGLGVYMCDVTRRARALLLRRRRHRLPAQVRSRRARALLPRRRRHRLRAQARRRAEPEPSTPPSASP